LFVVIGGTVAMQVADRENYLLSRSGGRARRLPAKQRLRGRLMDQTTTLIVPALGSVYTALMPVVEVALRAAAGLLLVPHGLRSYLGFFKGTGPPVASFTDMHTFLDGAGYRPGRFWAVVILLIEFVGAPLLALGLLTRPVALVAFIFLVYSAIFHWKIGRWFWNREGIEYPLLWAVVLLFFAVNGGGAYSLDRWLGLEF
jgi:putative oxidoreductase